MKSKIIAVILSTVVFVLILGLLFIVRQEKPQEEEQIAAEKDQQTEQASSTGYKSEYLMEGEHCQVGGEKFCLPGYSCEEGVCFPKFTYKEIDNPEEDKDYYEVAEGGPYKNDYILHVDRLVISEKLYVWIGNKKKPIWFKARRESELRPYEIEIPKGNSIRIRLSNRDKLHPPEFRGKIYLTKP